MYVCTICIIADLFVAIEQAQVTLLAQFGASAASNTVDQELLFKRLRNVVRLRAWFFCSSSVGTFLTTQTWILVLPDQLRPWSQLGCQIFLLVFFLHIRYIIDLSQVAYSLEMSAHQEAYIYG